MQSAGDKLRRLLAAFLEAYNRGDAAGAASFYAEDAVYMPSHQPAVRGRGAIQAFHSSMMERFSPQFSVTPEETQVADELPVQRGRYTVSLNDPDHGIVEDTGKYVVMCRENSGGVLELVWDIDNSDKPAA